MTKPPANPAAKFCCAAHLRRTGPRVAGFAIVADEVLCKRCFSGKPLDPAKKGDSSRSDVAPRIFHNFANARVTLSDTSQLASNSHARRPRHAKYDWRGFHTSFSEIVAEKRCYEF